MVTGNFSMKAKSYMVLALGLRSLAILNSTGAWSYLTKIGVGLLFAPKLYTIVIFLYSDVL